MALPQKPQLRLLLWLAAGTVAIVLAALLLDNPVDNALSVPNGLPLNRFALQCSKAGEGSFPAFIGISLTILFLLLKRPIVAAKIFFVVLTCEFTGFAGLILRIFVGRTRPLAHAPQGFYGVWHNGHWIIGQYDFSSFPSGHAATVAGLAAAAWMVHRGWGAVAALYALVVIWSRIALQCHHLSDVLASVVLAIPLAVLSKKVLLPFLEVNFAKLQRTGQNE